MSNERFKIINSFKEYQCENNIDIEKTANETGINIDLINTLLTEKKINSDNETIEKIEKYLTEKRKQEAAKAIEKINKLITETSLNKMQIAKKTGKSSAVISQYLNNKYPAGIAGEALNNITKSINELIRQIEYKIKNNIETVELFTDTTVSEDIFNTLEIAQNSVDMAIIQGASGIGKTYALKKFAKENPSMIYIYVLAGTTLMSLINELSEKLGIREIKKTEGRRSAALKEIIAKLKGTERMLVFDEAQRLSFNCLEMLRDISENAGISIILSGQETLYKNIIGSSNIRYDQLIGRFGLYKKLSGINEYDGDNLINLYFPKTIDKELRKELKEVLMKPGKIRALSKVSKAAYKLGRHNGSGIKDEYIKFALKLILQQEV